MNPEKDIVLQVRTLTNLIRRDIEKSKIKRDIVIPNGVHGWAIKYFYENRDENIFQKDFENKFSIRRSTASNILKLMEKNGFILRQSYETDARLKKIVLTEKAIQINNKITQDIKRREEVLRRDVTESELKTFFEVTEKFINNMEKDYD